MAEIRLESVTKRFGAVTAIDSLSLAVADGEFVVLLGPTGAGKTTTLRLVAGLEAPERGRIAIGGRDITDLAPVARDVAMVFQQYSLYPHLTVHDNLAFPLRAPVRRRPEAEVEAKVREVARLLRIEDKLANKATQLSGGEMQRVAIGRALVRRPAAFLLDEPLSSLDAKLREDLRIELKRIQIDLGATVLYVTHDQVEAMTLADRIGVLAAGRLIQIGTPQQIYGAPETFYVARRLGSPPINRLPAGALGLAAGPAGAVSVGVRPEDLVLGRGGVAARVRAVEPLGAETVMIVEAEGHEVHLLAGAGDRHRPGEETTIAVNAATALFFDREDHRIPWGQPDTAAIAPETARGH